MSLIQCPECGFSVSQTAPSCPNCGCKIADNLTTCKECGRTILKTSRGCPSCHCVNDDFVEQIEETENTLAEEQQKALKNRYAQVLLDEKKGRYKNALDAVNVLLLEYPQSKTFQDLKKRIVTKYVSKCLENADLNIRIRKYDEAMQFVEDGLLADRNNADLKKMMAKINKKKQGKTIKRLLQFLIFVLLVLGGIAIFWILKVTQPTKEREAWAQVVRFDQMKNPDSLEVVLERFMQEYRNGDQYPRAESMLTTLKKDRSDWQQALNKGTFKAFDNYCGQHNRGYYYVQAMEKRDSAMFYEAYSRHASKEIADDEYKALIQRYIDEFSDDEKGNGYRGKYLEKARQIAAELKDATMSSKEIDSVEELIRNHFKALSRQDEKGLLNTIADRLDLYVNQREATKADVVNYMNKLHGGDVTFLFLHPDKFRVEKVDSGDGTMVYNVKFNLIYDVETIDNMRTTLVYKGVAIVNKKLKIVKLIMSE